MTPLPSIAAAALLCGLLSGCLASTALDLATAPVRMAGKAVDLATTSQSEADEKRGRSLRQREARIGRLERDYRLHSQQCADGSRSACDKARTEYAQMRELLPTVPVERD